jgi:ankyrin repeat protein
MNSAPPYRRKTVALVTLLMSALLAAIFAGLMWREVRQAHLNHLLIVAVHTNDTAAVAALLPQGADPDARDVPEKPPTWRDLLTRWLRHSSTPRTDTALLITANQENNDLEIARLLLRAGANVNAVNVDGKTPLAAALAMNRADVMRELLAHKANPNVHVDDFNGKPSTTLIETIRTFNRPVFGETTCRELVKLLLDQGADFRAVAGDGSTALLAAIQRDEPEVAKQLMERGADINRADNNGVTPLYSSSWRYEDGIMQALLRRRVDIAPVHNAGWNLLCWAASADKIEVVRTALDRGLAVDSRDKNGRTALMYAAAYAHLQVLTTLLAHGAAVDARDPHGWTALMFAAQRSDSRVIQTLLQHGADANVRDAENHWTAGQRASHVGQERIALLLRAGQHRHNITVVNEELPAPRSSHDFQKHWDFEMKRQRMHVDSRRWLDAVRIGETTQSTDTRACRLTVLDVAGRAGKPLTLSYFFMPEIRIFADADGRRYACLLGHHRAEDEYLVAIEERSVKVRWQTDARYGADCQPLAGGGALITRFQRTRDVSSVPASHRDDGVAEVTRFRHGKLTALGLIYLPEQ